VTETEHHDGANGEDENELAWRHRLRVCGFDRLRIARAGAPLCGSGFTPRAFGSWGKKIAE